MTNIWISSGSIGHELLTSNLKEVNHQLIFLGAESGERDGEHKIHFMISQRFFKEANSMKLPMGGSNMGYSLMVSEGDELRYEGFWGIHREVTVQYGPEDFGLCHRFLPAKSIRFLRIEKDFIEYEVCC